jgi:hypothetical protein
MNIVATAANAAWIGASLAERRRFRAGLRDPLGTQAARLASCLRGNQETAIGRELGFARILSDGRHGGTDLVAAFRTRVPLITYDDLEPLIARIRTGEPGVLTKEVVRGLTPSSGSAAGRKLLPFTNELQREFGRAVDAWIADLYLAHPAASRGRSYWSISPAIPREQDGAIPIGFEEDSAYLGAARRMLARAVMVAPDAIAHVTDPEAFRYLSLLFLAGAGDLRLISVWHPSFLTRLLESLPQWAGRIVDDIAAGTLSPPAEVPPGVLLALRGRRRPDPARARALGRLSTLDPRSLWPRLALVSCWQDGAARPHADRLARLMPGVAVQGKGLIATEGVVSIPFGGLHPLAIRSHFLEFLDADDRPYLAHELAVGREYQVVLTTGGGLYRYRLGDRVEVDGRIDATPSIRFVGKDDRVSDLFGEKLSDRFVAQVVRRLFADRPAPRFAMVAPVELSGGYAYALFVESETHLPALASAFERELRRNPHYGWCVDMRQLLPARVVRARPGADRAYVDACVARGQRLGDIKPAFLGTDTGWQAILAPGPAEVHAAS